MAGSRGGSDAVPAPHPGVRVFGVLTVLAWLLLASCGNGSPTPTQHIQPPAMPVSSTPGAVPRPDHVLVVVFENKNYEQVIGAPPAPYLSSLAGQGANFTDAHGEVHPSQPNYLALLSGSTQGVDDDSCPQNLGPRPNLAAQLITNHLSFAGFSEAQPAPGFAGCTADHGHYARKHNPWVDFATAPAGANLPAAAFPTDFVALPTVSVLVPDMCSDMHDCPVAAGDTWARTHLPGYVSWARTHHSLLIVTFDEDDGTAANHIPTFFVGPMVRPGDVTGRIDHYTLLRTIEDMYGLAPLGAAATTGPVTGIWAS